MSESPRVCIVGGGISGLATAHYLLRLLPHADVTLLETDTRVGGIIRTGWRQGFCCEAGPDAFLEHKPEARELCIQVGLEADLISSRPEHRRSYLWSSGKLHPLPTLLNPPIRRREVEATSMLSPAGKRRALAEPRVAPGAPQEDETAEAFFARRFGPELAQRIVRPLIAGVFGGRADEISLPAAFPALKKCEHERGHLLQDEPPPEREASSSAPTFLSLKGGMEQLATRLRDTLEQRIQWQLASQAHRIVPLEGGYRVEAKTSAPEVFDHVAVCLSAIDASALLADHFPAIANPLEGIPYAPAIMVCLAFAEPVSNGKPGAGFLVSSQADEHCLLACTWVDHKFRGRSPRGCSMVRCYLSGNEALKRMTQDDESIRNDVSTDFQELTGIRRRPEFVEIHRLDRALPQYRLGHLGRMSALRSAIEKEKGLCVVGNYMDGVGIPDCVRHARQAARGIADLA